MERRSKQWALAAVMAACCTAAVAQEETPEAVYRIKDETHLGSNIPRTVVVATVVPINLRYSQFTEAHKAALRSLYESMPPDDEPPFPADGLKPLYDALWRVHHKLLVRGELSLVATVLPDGTVSQVQALQSPDPELTRAAASLLMATPFKPAVCHGQPCRMDYPLRMRFTVKL